MFIDEEMQQSIAKTMPYTSILTFTIAEEIIDQYSERAEQLKEVNDICGKLFNFFNPEEGTKMEVYLEENDND